MAKKYYWLKLQRDFFKRHDIRIIESMPNGKDYLLFYLKLLCESIDHNGNLRFSDQIPYNEDMLATITNTNVDIVRSAITVFTQLNMMELLDDGTFYMNEVEKMIGSETEWAEKKRKQRDLPNLCNGSTRLNADTLRLPDGSIRYVDEKRYGGNGMLVIDRAGGKCEICGSDENVVIHHNNGYSNDPQDLICLCSKCHGKVHSSTMGGKCPPVVPTMSDKSKSIDKDKDIDIDIEKDIENIKRKDESKDSSKREKSKFLPPTLDEVIAYCNERNNGIDPEAFIDFYESKGWMIGKNKMKDWKAAIRTWEKHEGQKKQGGGSAYMDAIKNRVSQVDDWV